MRAALRERPRHPASSSRTSPSFVTALDVPVEVSAASARSPMSVAWAGWRARSSTRRTSAVELVPEQARALGAAMADGLRGRAGADRVPPSAERRAVGGGGDRRDGPPARPGEPHARQTRRHPDRPDGHVAERHRHVRRAWPILDARGQLAPGRAVPHRGPAGAASSTAGSSARHRVGDVDGHRAEDSAVAAPGSPGTPATCSSDDDPFPRGLHDGRHLAGRPPRAPAAERLAAARRTPR